MNNQLHIILKSPASESIFKVIFRLKRQKSMDLMSKSLKLFSKHLRSIRGMYHSACRFYGSLRSLKLECVVKESFELREVISYMIAVDYLP